MQGSPRLLRVTTVPISLKLLLSGQVSFFKQHGFEVLTVSADGKERQDLLANGIKHSIVPMTRTIHPLQDLYCLLMLVRVIRQFKPTIVHTHTPKAGLLGMMAAWLCRVPVRMHTVAGLPLMEATGLKRIVLGITEALTYRCATKVYPNSTGLLQFIKNSFPAYERKYKIIGRGSSNGIDVTHFTTTATLANEANAIRSRHGITNELVFCFVGRVVRDKGIVELVEAFKRIREKYACKLILVGPLEQELDPLPDETIRFVQSSESVVLAGFQHDVRPWMLAASCFVFPSYREGFPNVVLQAACLEVPIIASNINGCNEIIEHKKTGLLVPAKNTDSLFNAMLEVIDNVQAAKQRARLARMFVSENFSQEYVWQELLKEY